MKNAAHKIAALAITAAALSTAAFAQNQKIAMKADIPFAFHTSRGTLPAGKYVVVENYSGIAGMFALRNTASSKTYLVSGITGDFKTSDAATMTFSCGGTCYLTQIRTTGKAVEFPDSRTPRQRELAAVAVHLTPANAE